MLYCNLFQNAHFYNEYRPMFTNAKEIAVKKDVKALEELCSAEVFSRFVIF